MGKVYTRFQTHKAPKTIPFGAAHTYMADIRENPPPAPGGGGGGRRLQISENVVGLGG